MFFLRKKQDSEILSADFSLPNIVVELEAVAEAADISHSLGDSRLRNPFSWMADLK